MGHPKIIQKEKEEEKDGRAGRMELKEGEEGHLG